MFSSYMTDDELHGRVPAVTAEARFVEQAGELSFKIAEKLRADVTAHARAFAETGRVDWGNTGDAQKALYDLIQIGFSIGAVKREDLDPRIVEAIG